MERRPRPASFALILGIVFLLMAIVGEIRKGRPVRRTASPAAKHEKPRNPYINYGVREQPQELTREERDEIWHKRVALATRYAEEKHGLVRREVASEGPKLGLPQPRPKSRFPEEGTFVPRTEMHVELNEMYGIPIPKEFVR